MPEKPNLADNNRIIYMSGNFNEDKAKEIVTRMFELETRNPNDDILLYIDSYGGHVHSFLAIHDAMKMLRCDVATVCIGKAMSCGQMLLISGTKGKRFITPNSRVLIHQVSSVAYGKISDIELDISESKELQKILESMIIKYTKISSKELKSIMGFDSYFSAKQSLEMGLVDHIITSPNVLYKNIKV